MPDGIGLSPRTGLTQFCTTALTTVTSSRLGVIPNPKLKGNGKLITRPLHDGVGYTLVSIYGAATK